MSKLTFGVRCSSVYVRNSTCADTVGTTGSTTLTGKPSEGKRRSRKSERRCAWSEVGESAAKMGRRSSTVRGKSDDSHTVPPYTFRLCTSFSPSTMMACAADAGRALVAKATVSKVDRSTAYRASSNGSVCSSRLPRRARLPPPRRLPATSGSLSSVPLSSPPSSSAAATAAATVAPAAAASSSSSSRRARWSSLVMSVIVGSGGASPRRRSHVSMIMSARS
mmetsp:Transcript_10747/g.34083  ORF Transcript_10747/g.34083 Transcript_10747/m.34083 type:complete len:222 (-) Transcript_10747:1328-1993(-)